MTMGSHDRARARAVGSPRRARPGFREPADGEPLLCPLDAVEARDAPRVGRKAAALGPLLRAGFPVPPGLVLTVRAFEATTDELPDGVRHMSEGGVAPGAADLPLPAAVRRAVADIATRFDGTAMAVRSSGVAEDLPDSSHAGRYTTTLGVRGREGLTEAVRACYASAFAPGGGAVRPGRPPGMAVLVQPMVAAEAAGVAFSVNPVDGSRDDVVVNAVPGLGDRLVNGQEKPDEWVLHGEDPPRQTAGDRRALPAEHIAAVAVLTRRVADRARCPQDIEWAWAAGAPVLLQARPVTALPRAAERTPVAVEVPPGRWLRGGYTLKPLTPMNVGTLIRSVNSSSAALFRYAFGERIAVRSLGGWSYIRIVPLSDADAARQRAERVLAALRADEPYALVERWHARWQPWLAGRTAAAAETSLPRLTDTALLTELDDRIRLADRAQHAHFLIGGAANLVWAEFGVLCRELLGGGTEKLLPLLTGLRGKSSEPALELGRLAALARATPAVRRAVEACAPVGDVEAADPGFARAFRRYLRDYGQRCLGSDVAEPSLFEQPETVLRLLGGQLTVGSDPGEAMRRTVREREAAADSARALLAPDDRARFDRALLRAERAFPLRDDTGFYAHTCWGQVRYALLELGARLVAAGLLDATHDVFLLSADEARDALRHGTRARALTARRRREQNWSAAHLGPLTYGEPETAPGLPDILPELGEQERELLEPIRWIDSVSHLGARGSAAPGSRLLRGTAASAGRYTGTVRVIVSEREFGRLGPGDVLVCPETTPQWSVLFGSIGALVTDTGGLLSHPSILAREHGVPAVVATGNATQVLRDGQVVEVDGRAGTVRVVDVAVTT